MSEQAARFLFVTCQVGAEAAVKGEVARNHPTFRFSYSRPGFLTFKLPSDLPADDDFELCSIFARAWGFSLGKAVGETAEARTSEAWKHAAGRSFDRLHVWPRDRLAAGEHGYQPGATPESVEAADVLRSTAPAEQTAATSATSTAKTGETVLDCILVDPQLWWVGWHRARSFASRYPGGMLDLQLPEKAVSRAYLKMEEALRWSRLPIRRGDVVAEIGCAPGGSCQALLRRGLYVLGIDPALVDPAVAEHPRFEQIRKRASEVRRREFRRVRWLVADMNVAPTFTLDAVEAIVSYPQVQIHGLLLTLKLADWQLASDLPAQLDRIRSWGFSNVWARQLQFNRQEVCVAALRGKTRTKYPSPSGRRWPEAG